MEIGQVYYDASSQWALNIVLASMILGIALDIHSSDFKAVIKMPKAILAGLIAQFLILPAMTGCLTLLLELPPGIELGMILVASCPGGAISNFITHLSKGNTALSISMTAVASSMAIFMMPLNFLFWGELNPETATIMKSINVSGGSLFINLFFVLAIPLAIGLLLRHQMANFAKKLHKILKYLSIVALLGFIFIAVFRNKEAFFSHFELIFAVVFIHNILALLLGFVAGWSLKLANADIKATTIEVGMQNSSLAIAIVFSQFNGETGMALISAFWGTWHIVSGLLIALLFRRWGNFPQSENLSGTS
ncbi:MAG: BASS family bile acid:Na+ symporter [Enterobacterales bacterium]|jgi:BASS family bile acid:Na+ symporter